MFDVHKTNALSWFAGEKKRWTPNAVSGFTVPAINIRALTYDTAQAVFRAAHAAGVGAMIFEIARSEIDYTRQRPEEYTCVVLAAALKTGYHGPLFLQGDHFQVGAKKYAKDPDAEVKAVKDLICRYKAMQGFRVDVDERGERMQAKIRDAQLRRDRGRVERPAGAMRATTSGP
jgi:hypothetical protein